MSQRGTLDGSDSNGSGLWETAVNPRREQGQHVSVVALTIKFKKKGEAVLDRNKPSGPLEDHGNRCENVKRPLAPQATYVLVIYLLRRGSLISHPFLVDLCTFNEESA